MISIGFTLPNKIPLSTTHLIIGTRALIVCILHIGIIYWIIERDVKQQSPSKQTELAYVQVLPTKSSLSLFSSSHLLKNISTAVRTQKSQLIELKISSENSTQILNSTKSNAEYITATKEEPKLIIADLLALARKNDHERVKTGIDKMEEDQAFLKNKEAEAVRGIGRAVREDCRTAHATKELNLLKIIPLVLATVSDTGCKW